MLRFAAQASPKSRWAAFAAIERENERKMLREQAKISEARPRNSLSFTVDLGSMNSLWTDRRRSTGPNRVLADAQRHMKKPDNNGGEATTTTATATTEACLPSIE